MSRRTKPDTFESMAIRPVLLYPDPVLLEPTRPVGSVDDDVRELVVDMVDTMYNAPGIGLAANQLGDSRRVCIVDLSVGKDPEGLHVLIDPVIRETRGSEVGEEGCLSFPDVMLDIERAEQVTVEALDLEGERRLVTAEGLLARATQVDVGLEAQGRLEGVLAGRQHDLAAARCKGLVDLFLNLGRSHGYTVQFEKNRYRL